jgi:hypothetical protein
MSETATRFPYSTAAGLAIFASVNGGTACDIDLWTRGKVVSGELELDVDGEAAFAAEMAAWNAASDRALLSCDAWE